MLFFIAHEQKERSIPCPCSEGSVALGSEMLRGVDTERSECAQHDSAVTHTDSWINLLNCIIGPYRFPDYFANDLNRLSIVECGFIKHVSVGTLSSYSPDSPVSCVSNQLRESLRATTAPITVMAGDVMFAFLAHSA